MNHAIQAHDWIVPIVQSIHILGIAVVVSSALMINLRLLGPYATPDASYPCRPIEITASSVRRPSMSQNFWKSGPSR